VYIIGKEYSSETSYYAGYTDEGNSSATDIDLQ
jgi:hypothetical protein